ncbi:heat shock 70 kDa protein 12B-like [Mercenaria mercenaria]|uniref:heat shock 70 kDa protein 12B-like n=1 Tax=Mercenaria mercenaria TaxID=6596 RepID=UPI00234F7F32|nr:heat shock 70 kDa protein 12B-like [Mercenaria mercenaria]
MGYSNCLFLAGFMLGCLDFTTAGSAYSLVVAFDIGTSYSGYAFSFRNDSLNITYADLDHQSPKTLSSVLLTPRREFHSFGTQAENKYQELAEDFSNNEWLLFRGFKMVLQNDTKITRSTTVEDINGVSVPAISIFTMSIRFLKNHFLNKVTKQFPGLEENDIRYVLTVPAIWGDTAKSFMRKAAVEAGIWNSNLKLALESEEAFIGWQTVMAGKEAALSKPGARFMVLDLGGGIVESSVQEIQQEQDKTTLKVVHKASGGPWGGNTVNNNFLQLLTNLFSRPVMERFKKDNMADFLELEKEFEQKKRHLAAKGDGNINFYGLASLVDIYNSKVEQTTLREKIAAMGFSERISYNLTSSVLKVDKSVIKELFSSPLGNIISFVKNITGEPGMQSVKTMIVLGGFGKSEIVRDELQKQITGLQIITPKDADVVVLNGTVLFGHTPDCIIARVMTYTYGVRVMENFNANIHPIEKMVKIGEKEMVDDIFDVLVHVDEEVKVGQEIKRDFLNEINVQKKGLFIYKSTERDPDYVTGKGCSLLGEVLLDKEGNISNDGRADVTFVFGDTELSVKVRSKTRLTMKYITTLY